MNGFAGFMGRTLRGVRLVEFAALLVLLVMATGVYLAKAAAGRERADITQVQGQIDDENKRLRLLQAEVAHLEEPERLARLSAQIATSALIPDKAVKKSSAVLVKAAATGAPQ